MENKKTIEEIRADFPLLSITPNGKPYIYFDNAATTQKPQSVLDASEFYYKNLNIKSFDKMTNCFRS